MSQTDPIKMIVTTQTELKHFHIRRTRIRDWNSLRTSFGSTTSCVWFASDSKTKWCNRTTMSEPVCAVRCGRHTYTHMRRTEKESFEASSLKQPDTPTQSHQCPQRRTFECERESKEANEQYEWKKKLYTETDWICLLKKYWKKSAVCVSVRRSQAQRAQQRKKQTSPCTRIPCKRNASENPARIKCSPSVSVRQPWKNSYVCVCVYVSACQAKPKTEEKICSNRCACNGCYRKRTSQICCVCVENSKRQSTQQFLGPVNTGIGWRANYSRRIWPGPKGRNDGKKLLANFFFFFQINVARTTHIDSKYRLFVGCWAASIKPSKVSGSTKSGAKEISEKSIQTEHENDRHKACIEMCMCRALWRHTLA